MTRSRVFVHGLVAVVLLALVFVHDSDSNRRAERDAKLCSRLDFYAILFIAWSRNGRLARSASCHLGLDVGLCQRHARRATVNDGADRETVGFAIGGDPEVRSECRHAVAVVEGLKLDSRMRMQFAPDKEKRTS